MPYHLVVIEHNGDYVTCIDVSKNNGEVVTWSWIDDGKISKIALIPLKSISQLN